MKELIALYNINETRKSKDTATNNFCIPLFETCMSLNLLIVNGRVEGDLEGELTCKDASLVDYVIASPNLFEDISYFRVGDFDRCISDVHCPVHVHLKCNLYHHDPDQQMQDEYQNQSDSTISFKPVWKQESAERFHNGIDNGKLNQLFDTIRRLHQGNPDHVTQQDVDLAAKDIADTFHDAAKNSDMLKPVPKTIVKRKVRKLTFFDREC